MMRHIRFILSIFSLLMGASIVFVSLSAVSPVLSTEAPASHKRFYLSDPIMPDHVAYPVLMIGDRVALETAHGEERVELQLEYGLRRLDYTQRLLEKNDSALALTTLTKSQKYIIQAAHDALNENTSAELREQVLKVLIRYSQETQTLANEFSDSERVMVDQLIHESDIAQAQLRESLATK